MDARSRRRTVSTSRINEDQNRWRSSSTNPLNPISAESQKHHACINNGEGDVQYQTLVGCCQHMCPENERKHRERLRDLSVFERLNGNQFMSSPELAVKKFCRTISSADISPSDIRPLPVLWNTMNYLIKFVDNSEHGFEVVHEFLFDRMRAIRQELKMQHIVHEQAVTILERMVRFHILSHHRLVRLDNSENSPMIPLNLEQLLKCLKSLFDLYEAMDTEKENDSKSEFCSYFILLNMGCTDMPHGESLSLWFRTISPALLKMKRVKFARNVLRHYRLGNFISLFNLLKEATYLEACLIQCYCQDVRAQALACINCSAYKMSPFPLDDLAIMLKITDNDMVDFCKLCNLVTSTDDQGYKILTVRQTSFKFPNKRFTYHSCSLVEEKLTSTYYKEIMDLLLGSATQRFSFSSTSELQVKQRFVIYRDRDRGSDERFSRNLNKQTKEPA